MGIQHFLLLLIYLDPLNVLCTLTAKRVKPAPKRTQKPKELNNTTTVVPSASTQRITQVRPSHTHETCLGYFDVSGQFDKEFECNNTDHRYCCGSCYLRFCCQFKGNRLDQKTCKNYQKPDWVKTVPPSPIPTGDTYDPSMDQTNMAVYITCGVIAFIIVVGVSTKVAYDKATQPPQEMNIHRALADILRQQGPIPISQYGCENFAAMNNSPKGNTPQRTGSKNHYTPVHGSKSNHESTRMNSILTSQTEPYDLSFSRSFQSLSHLPPSYESAVKADLNKYSSLKRLTDKDMDDYYSRKRHIPDLAARGTLPLHMIKMNQESQSSQQVQQPQQQPPRQHPRRVQRAMSQDRVLSPERSHVQDYAMSSYGMSPYGGRILSDEQLLSAEHRLHSQDPLISPDKMMSIKRSGFCSEKSMSRAISQTDVFMPTTPILDRYKMTKMHSHPSASNSITQNTLTMNQTASKRQAFASRRTQTVEQLHYVPQQHHHHYRTGSKTEVTV
ncbi:protein shisa-6-like isoform X5 [Xyrauchen texanus]|uniref:protein shisa-6-like isoform X5 n=1 Tax=Xyrauchen texanus TaxID=154827 RepID=UPI002242BF21|nr:protein shisa-6-like isoform X5 [Xyrauchen texanus]